MNCPVTGNTINKISRNNASINEIREDSMFRDLLNGEYNEGYLKSQDILELRRLKQALNNHICIHLFQNFINEFGVDFEQFLPSVNEDGKIEKVSPEVAITQLPINEKITGVMIPHIIACMVTKTKKRIIGEYLSVFTQVIVEHFESKINELQNSKIRDLQVVFLILDKYISAHFSKKTKGALSITGETKFLFPNTHLPEFLRLIEESQDSLSLQDIDVFLKSQTKEKLQQSKSTNGGMKYNAGAIYLCPQDKVYKILEGTLILPGKVVFDQVMPTIQGCPFAASKIGEKNAFQLMFEMFNNFYMQIIKHLHNQGISLNN